MRRTLLAAIAAVGLAGLVSGCASSSYGTFLSDAPSALLDGVSSDAIQKLATRWKPAKTRLALQHTAEDPFGASFVGALRGQGYSVLEFTPPRKAADTATSADPNDAVPLSYVLDRVGDVYRLKLVAGREVLSRAYVVSAGQFAPAGAWSLLRQE